MHSEGGLKTAVPPNSFKMQYNASRPAASFGILQNLKGNERRSGSGRIGRKFGESGVLKADPADTRFSKTYDLSCRCREKPSRCIVNFARSQNLL